MATVTGRYAVDWAQITVCWARLFGNKFSRLLSSEHHQMGDVFASMHSTPGPAVYWAWLTEWRFPPFLLLAVCCAHPMPAVYWAWLLKWQDWLVAAPYWAHQGCCWVPCIGELPCTCFLGRCIQSLTALCRASYAALAAACLAVGCSGCVWRYCFLRGRVGRWRSIGVHFGYCLPCIGKLLTCGSSCCCLFGIEVCSGAVGCVSAHGWE